MSKILFSIALFFITSSAARAMFLVPEDTRSNTEKWEAEREQWTELFNERFETLLPEQVQSIKAGSKFCLEKDGNFELKDDGRYKDLQKNTDCFFTSTIAKGFSVGRSANLYLLLFKQDGGSVVERGWVKMY